MTPKEAFEQYHQAVFSFVYRLTGRQELADDITQECFLALIRAPERFDAARGTLKTFLFSIARNLVLKNYRDYGTETELDEGDGQTVLAKDPRPGMEASTAVAQAVAGLPPMQREALVLFEYEGATLEEIARITGADVGTVKSRLHRARARLKRELAPYKRVGDRYGTVRA